MELLLGSHYWFNHTRHRNTRFVYIRFISRGACDVAPVCKSAVVPTFEMRHNTALRVSRHAPDVISILWVYILEIEAITSQFRIKRPSGALCKLVQELIGPMERVTPSILIIIYTGRKPAIWEPN